MCLSGDKGDLVFEQIASQTAFRNKLSSRTEVPLYITWVLYCVFTTQGQVSFYPHSSYFYPLLPSPTPLPSVCFFFFLISAFSRISRENHTCEFPAQSLKASFIYKFVFSNRLQVMGRTVLFISLFLTQSLAVRR